MSGDEINTQKVNKKFNFKNCYTEEKKMNKKHFLWRLVREEIQLLACLIENCET